MSIGWKLKNLDFDNTFVQRCGGLLLMYFITMFFWMIGICKHVNVAYVGDTCDQCINQFQLQWWNVL
jgi:hypothetical protein